MTQPEHAFPAESAAPAAPPGWHELTAPAGIAALELAATLHDSGVTFDAISTALRKTVSDPGLVAATLTVVSLRERAVAKFGPSARQMLFTQAGLEQASRRVVSELHAARFAGSSSVTDLGCGIGSESLAFLRAGLAVTAVEIDPLTANFARHNLAAAAQALGPHAPPFAVLTGDATDLSLAATEAHGTPGARGTADAVFLDPARRTRGHRDTRRLTSPDDYSPSLQFAFAAARAAHAGGIKLGPGFDRELIPADAEAQWVSVAGQLVEMALWFGAAARPGVRRAATVIRTDASGVPLTEPSELTAESDAEDVPVRALGEYVIEPDGAVIRARLIGTLAATIGAGMLSTGIAYLTADHHPETPFGQVFRVLEELPANEKQLRRELRARGVGKLEIKKRGVDVDPAALRTRLRLQGPASGTLILSRSEGRHVALLVERC